MFEIKKKFENFLEEDINSRVCLNKEGYVTKNKFTIKKRFLTNTLKNLHRNFLWKYPKIEVCYTFLCRCRPFWIMKMADRDTCKCLIHSNMELIIDCLWKNNIISHKSTHQIEASTCENRSEQCLLRQCRECSSHKIMYTESFDTDEVVSSSQWLNFK